MSKSLKIILGFLLVMSVLTFLVKKPEHKNLSDELTMTFADFDQIISEDIPQINSIELADLIMQQKDHYILYNLQNDLNTINEIPSSEQLTLSEIKNLNLPLNNKIILYDLYEEKAIQAYYLLNIKGYYNIAILNGGYSSWQSSILNPDSTNLSLNKLEKLKTLSAFFGGNFKTNYSNHTKKPLLRKIEKKIKEHHGC